MKKNQCRTSKSCKTAFRIREAGHKLKTSGSADSARLLSTEGKSAKRKRAKKGCLEGTPSVKPLSAAQKRNLPKAMQAGLLAYRKRKANGKRA
jgi:hypothetical protein